MNTQAELKKKQIDKGLRISIYEGSFAAVFTALTTGPFLAGYALYLGANDFQLGLVAAFPFLAQAFQLPGALIIEKLRRRKKFNLLGSLLFRSIFLIFVFLPFFPENQHVKIGIFLLFLSISSAVANLVAVAWLSWMSDLVPEENRGRYFGIRNTTLGFITMGSNFAGAKLIDYFRTDSARISYYLPDFISGFLKENPAGFAFSLIFLLAVLSALMAAFFLSHQPEPKMLSHQKVSLTDALRIPLSDKNFRTLIYFFIYWSLVTGISAPFWTPHMLKNLHLDFYLISLFSILAGVVGLFMQPLWGKAIDKYGNKPVLTFNVVFIFLIPFLWLFVTPQNIFPLWIDAVMGGIFWSGFTLASFNVVIALSPQQGRSYYLATIAATNGVVLFISAALGGIIAQQLGWFRLVFKGQVFLNFHILFVLSGAGRIFGLLFLKKLKEHKSRPTQEMVQEMGYLFFNRLPLGKGTWTLVTWAISAFGVKKKITGGKNL
ncbi:MAG: MFS transporter [candidate division Zixibacteria bacterium]|nr:MFS transporter [candidate division Zixibacteria bacterium]